MAYTVHYEQHVQQYKRTIFLLIILAGKHL